MSKQFRVLLAGKKRMAHAADSYPASIRAEFERHGESCETTVIAEDDYGSIDLASIDPDASDLLIFNSALPTESWSGLQSLRRVIKLGRLRPGIDVKALDERGIHYEQLADPAGSGVSEHTMLLMLACARRWNDSVVQVGMPRPSDWPTPMTTSQNQRQNNWIGLDPRTFRLLLRSRVGILGLGEIGAELAARANAFGMDVVYHNRTQLPAEIERSLNVRYVSKDELLTTSSFIVVMVTIQEGAPPALDKDSIDAIADGTIVINISRGGAVDQQALIERARSGSLGGLGLDVFVVEPVDPTEFADCENTYLTAHVALLHPPGRRISDFVDTVVRLSRSGV